MCTIKQASRLTGVAEASPPGSRRAGAARAAQPWWSGSPPAGTTTWGHWPSPPAARRCGMDVLYLGADVPADRWEAAVRARGARAAVLSAPMADDRPAAVAGAHRLRAVDPAPLVCAGGAYGAGLADGVHDLAPSIALATAQLDELLHQAGQG